jgi:hypothetical protein
MKSTGEAEARELIKQLVMDAPARAAANAKVMATFTNRPPYSVEELMSTPFNGHFLTTVSSSNPHRVRCPLCRRTKTVQLLATAAVGPREKPVSEYRCIYDGCRGLEFSI